MRAIRIVVWPSTKLSLYAIIIASYPDFNFVKRNDEMKRTFLVSVFLLLLLAPSLLCTQKVSTL